MKTMTTPVTRARSVASLRLQPRPPRSFSERGWGILRSTSALVQEAVTVGRLELA
jgi:hypothetical protein